MRRTALAAALPLLLAAACGTAQKSASTASPAPSAASTVQATAADIKVTGEVGKKPIVTFPPGKPQLTSTSRTIVEGRGAGAKDGDILAVNVTVFTWDGKENKPVGSNYDPGSRTEFTAVSPELPKGLHEALLGAKPGGRVLAVVGKDALTPQKLEEAKRQGTDFTTSSQVLVVDVMSTALRKIEGSATDPGIPGITLKNPKGGRAPVLTTKTGLKPPDRLVVKTVIKGTGPAVKAGQTVLTHYIGKIWGSGKQFDSSWDRGVPAALSLDRVVKGWSQGLTGVPVGSRVLLTIPPELGYGKEGQKEAGIKGTDTLVFVVDVLGVA